MVRSVLGKRYIYIRNYMPHKPYGQHVNYMFITPTQFGSNSMTKVSSTPPNPLLEDQTC